MTVKPYPKEPRMKKVLIAVDESRGSQATVDTFINLFSCVRPETVILLYVEKIEGRSLMDDARPGGDVHLEGTIAGD